MANVIREDVVNIGFDIDLKALTQLQNDIDQIKKAFGGGLGDDALNDFKENTEEAVKPVKKLKENLNDLGKKAASTAYNGLKKVASISFKALVVGAGAAAAAVSALVTQSVQAFADFEQLKGGVETLLGAKGAKSVEEYAKLVGKSVKDVQKEYSTLKESENLVMKNANNAYKTAGLSANEYMETVTSFSASLLQSVGGDTVKAAKYADTAVSDMADNANKMGLIKKSSCKTNRIAGKSLKPNKLQRDLKKCA